MNQICKINEVVNSSTWQERYPCLANGAVGFTFFVEVGNFYLNVKFNEILECIEFSVRDELQNTIQFYRRACEDVNLFFCEVLHDYRLEFKNGEFWLGEFNESL